MLISAFMILVNNSFQKNSDITFMKNEKNYQNKFFFSFFIKTFLKWIINQYSKGINQHFPINNWAPGLSLLPISKFDIFLFVLND